jgi:type I restriction enzyme S subunit
MGEVANIPQLRFPEFSNEWEESKVGKVFKVSAGGDIKTENVSQIKTDGFPYPIYANAEKAKGLYGYSNLYKSEANVVTVAGRGVNIGIAHVRLEPFYPIVRLLVLNPIKDADVKFWENQLNQLNLFVESTGVPQLTAPQISSYKVKYPSKPEQQKIAAFLTAVDNKIEQLSKKQELLGEYKKGLMQQIFSQATRFKADDDSEFPDWEERVLGDYLAHKSKKNKNNEVDLVLSVSNKKGFITQDEQFDGYQVASKDLTNYKIVEKGEYAYNPSRINVGSIARLKNNTIGIVSPMYVVFKLKNLDSIFFDNLYQTHLFKHLIKVGCSGSVRDSLNFNDMADFVFSFPSLEEQAKIANFLSSIDSKIEQVGKQLDESKQFKKALLQQMFV